MKVRLKDKKIAFISLASSLLLGPVAFAASPTAMTMAIQAASLSVTNIKDVREVEVLRCPDCSLIEVSGEGAYGAAYVKVKVERTSRSAYQATIVEQSK